MLGKYTKFAIMVVKWPIITLLHVKMMFCLMYYGDDGLIIKYSAKFGNACSSEEGRFAIMYGLSIGECVRECGLRKHCKALNFERRSNVCELFASDGGADTHKGGCIRVLSQDIVINQTPCNDCTYGEVCDTTTKHCIYKECTSTDPLINGAILGNMRNVGSKLRFECDHGFSLGNGVSAAECNTSGSWNATAECVIASPCGELPSIPYGTAVHAEGSSNLNTANVICDLWYQTRKNVIMCTEAGDWEIATCADCYLTTSQEYQGKRNSTKNGVPCLNWEDMSPHKFHNFALLPDASVTEAKNYCRNPDSDDYDPWCYTSYNHAWGYCGIDACD